MIAAALLLAILAQPPESEIVHARVSGAIGYGTSLTMIEAGCVPPQDGRPVPEGLCNPTEAQGLGLALSTQLLLGGFVRGGVELELGATFGSGTALTASILGVARVGWDVFADVGAGVGYAWVREERVFQGDVSGGDVGLALAARAGVRVTDDLSLFVRSSYVYRYRAPLFFGVGAEWRL